MSWTAPRTWTSAEIVTAGHLNEQVRDNDLYLKAEADKLNDCSHSDVTASRTDNTIYQNTSGKIMIVTVILGNEGGVGDTSIASAYIENVTPPTIMVARANTDHDSDIDFDSMSFVVPVDWYYKVDFAADFVIEDWHEWILH